MTKEEDGSRSAYIAHIGGFFTFVALAGLSLIGWGLNHHCWSKKSCCFKEYHNPLNIRVFWWMSFMGLCGVFACCISGFVTSHRFSNKIQTTKCVYERIYYDSIFGEIKKDDTKWVGLEKNREGIIENFKEFLFIKEEYDSPFNFEDNKWYNENIKPLDPKVYYQKEFVDTSQNNIFYECQKYPGSSLRDLNGELICDSKLDDENSLVSRYINNVTTITKYFSDEVIKIKAFINNKTKSRREKSYEKELQITENTLNEIYSGLNIYKTEFLKKEADYYINVSNICGYILVTIYYSILLAIVLCSCFLLWAYSYFKEQKLIYTFMHVSWNILKFFSFSFFMFGAAFGALYLVSRDLIGYNQFLFSENLAPNTTTKLLPNDTTTKEFLRYCINKEGSNYINNFEIPSIVLLKDLYYNMKKGKEINDEYISSKLQGNIDCYRVIGENLRNIDEDDGDSTDDSEDVITLKFDDVNEAVKNMIKQIHDALYLDPIVRILDGNKHQIISNIEKLGEAIEKLNCGYLYTEIQILYGSLYELSTESRISCALCCCIGFFLEFSIAFYLLVLYHYNNTEFKDDNDTQKSFPKNRNRKFDLDSQNEFMDKSRPPNMKKNNRKLDLEFNFN